MAEKRQRNYAREYQRRNELARQRGFRSYGQQRHYIEYTGTPASYLFNVSPEEIAETYERSAYDYANYSEGDDRLLDAWIRRSESRGIDPEEAFRTYKRQARGGSLSKEQVRRLARREYGQEWNQEWSTS